MRFVSAVALLQRMCAIGCADQNSFSGFFMSYKADTVTFVCCTLFILGCRSEPPPIEYINGRWADQQSIPDSLTIGDTGPSVHSAHWATGKQQSGFEKGKVHVVEFWATWCPPCLKAMPHMSELAREYSDEVQFFGVTREDVGTVEEFLDSKCPSSPGSNWRDVIRYNLICDEGDRTSESYMKASGEQMIPTAFIVGYDGRVDWIGSPFEIDEPLEKVVRGEWDRDTAKAERDGDQQIASSKSTYERAIQAGDFGTAIDQLERIQELTGEDLSVMRLMVLGKLERIDEIQELITKMKEESWDDPVGLTNLSLLISVELPKKLNAQSVAIEMSLRANELSDGKQPPVLDSLALAYYKDGQLDQAIEWQQAAAKLAPDSERIQSTLRKYLAERDEN